MVGAAILRLASRCLALFAGISACAISPERLPQLDRQFYYNLSSETEQKTFLELPRASRRFFLVAHGLWEKWDALTAAEQQSVHHQQVHLKMSVFVAHMVWGAPADVRYQQVYNGELRLETFIRCTSGAKVGRYVHKSTDCDGTSAEQLIAVDRGKIIEIQYMD